MGTRRPPPPTHTNSPRSRPHLSPCSTHLSSLVALEPLCSFPASPLLHFLSPLTPSSCKPPLLLPFKTTDPLLPITPHALQIHQPACHLTPPPPICTSQSPHPVAPQKITAPAPPIKSIETSNNPPWLHLTNHPPRLHLPITLPCTSNSPPPCTLQSPPAPHNHPRHSNHPLHLPINPPHLTSPFLHLTPPAPPITPIAPPITPPVTSITPSTPITHPALHNHHHHDLQIHPPAKTFPPPNPPPPCTYPIHPPLCTSNQPPAPQSPPPPPLLAPHHAPPITHPCTSIQPPPPPTSNPTSPLHFTSPSLQLNPLYLHLPCTSPLQPPPPCHPHPLNLTPTHRRPQLCTHSPTRQTLTQKTPATTTALLPPSNPLPPLSLRPDITDPTASQSPTDPPSQNTQTALTTHAPPAASHPSRTPTHRQHSQPTRQPPPHTLAGPPLTHSTHNPRATRRLTP
ncbi:hypothetical protein FKM82_010924 [Ascaphus truei]